MLQLTTVQSNALLYMGGLSITLYRVSGAGVCLDMPVREAINNYHPQKQQEVAAFSVVFPVAAGIHP